MIGDARGGATYEDMVEQMGDSWAQPTSRRSGYLHVVLGSPGEPWDDRHVETFRGWPAGDFDWEAGCPNSLSQPSEESYPDGWCTHDPCIDLEWASGPWQAHVCPSGQGNSEADVNTAIVDPGEFNA